MQKRRKQTNKQKDKQNRNVIKRKAKNKITSGDLDEVGKIFMSVFVVVAHINGKSCVDGTWRSGKNIRNQRVVILANSMRAKHENQHI